MQILLNELEEIEVFSRCSTEKDRIKRVEILKKVQELDVLIVKFDKSNHFTYKNQSKLILHYPSKKFLKKEIVKYVLKKKLPLLGLIFLSQTSSSNKGSIIPFAECRIDNVFIPDEMTEYWEEIIIKSEATGKSFYQVYSIYIEKTLIAVNPNLANCFTIFFNQIKKDEDIKEYIKYNPSTLKLEKKDSHFLWIECEVLEYSSSSHLKILNKEVRFSDYLKDYKLYQHSIALGLTMKQYLEYKKYLVHSSDYCTGTDAIRKSFVFLDEVDKVKNVQYLARYKSFSELAWRDLICTEQFVFKNNEHNIYFLLFHLIWEAKNNTKYSIIDFATEVRCKNLNGLQNYFIDAFIHLVNNNGKHIKLYIEFKNYSKTLYDDPKDYIHQPRSIVNNLFYSDRYKHELGDEWYYVGITKGSPYHNGLLSLSGSGLKDDNYINFTWDEFFSLLSNQIQSIAYNAIDKNLDNFLMFLERV